MQAKNGAITLALLVVAIALGVAVFNKKSGNDNVQNPGNNNQQAQQGEQLLSDEQYDKDLPEELKKLFYTPGPDAPKEEVDAHYKLAESLAQPGDTISINFCSATPSVLATNIKTDLKVKNTGTVDIKFGFEPDNKVTIKPGVTQTFKPEIYNHGPGLYGYGCENPGVRRAIGMILLAP